MRAFVDESSSQRGPGLQEYLIAAALLEDDHEESARESLRPLLLRGQVKLHWSDESERRRREIVNAVATLGVLNVIVSHVSAPQRKTERFRRKCLEVLYYELAGAGVTEMTLESRSGSQDKSDRAHLVGLQNQGRSKALRVEHRRGGEEPLLWVPDVVLGAINAARCGHPVHLDALRDSIVLEERTADSLSFM